MQTAFHMESWAFNFLHVEGVLYITRMGSNTKYECQLGLRIEVDFGVGNLRVPYPLYRTLGSGNSPDRQKHQQERVECWSLLSFSFPINENLLLCKLLTLVTTTSIL